jgi:hypothetical protein
LSWKAGLGFGAVSAAPPKPASFSVVLLKLSNKIYGKSLAVPFKKKKNKKIFWHLNTA